MGNVKDFVIEQGVLKAYKGCDTHITIPNGVIAIGERAFEYGTSLISITLPSTVTSIGSHAFFECCDLASITIPDSVKSIGKGAFYRCLSLKKIILPNAVTRIEKILSMSAALLGVSQSLPLCRVLKQKHSPVAQLLKK